MVAIQKVLESIERYEVGEIGDVAKVSQGHWIIGDEPILPVQLEKLSEVGEYLLYATVFHKTAEPSYTPLMTTMFMEHLSGHSLGSYGICVGALTMTLYQRMTIRTPAAAERLAAMIICHRMLMDCYIGGDFDPEDDPHLPVSQHRIAKSMRFCH